MVDPMVLSGISSVGVSNTGGFVSLVSGLYSGCVGNNAGRIGSSVLGVLEPLGVAGLLYGVTFGNLGFGVGFGGGAVFGSFNSLQDKLVVSSVRWLYFGY